MQWHLFASRVRKAGLRPVRRNPTHWQIQGGIFLVNFYPGGRKGPTLYVAGSVSGKRLQGDDDAQLRQVIAAASTPPRREKRDSRSKDSQKRRRHKQRLMGRDPHCYWCRIELTLEEEKVSDTVRYATLDHKVPLGAGGLEHSNNYVLACEPCNLARGDRTGAPPTEPREPARETS